MLNNSGLLPGIIENNSSESSWRKSTKPLNNDLEKNLKTRSLSESDREGHRSLTQTNNSQVEVENDLEANMLLLYTQRLAAPLNLLRTANDASMVRLSDIDLSATSSVEEEQGLSRNKPYYFYHETDLKA